MSDNGKSGLVTAFSRWNPFVRLRKSATPAPAPGPSRPLQPAPVPGAAQNKIFESSGSMGFGPGQPMPPTEPPGTMPRRWQYQPYINYALLPRGTEGITFQQLRDMSEVTIMRTIIEHVKKQLKAHEWDIIPVDKATGQAHAADVLAAKKFFDKPDREHDWGEWLSIVLEEILTIDALSIYRRKTYGGQPYAMEVLDGTLIRPLIDNRGMSPQFDADGNEAPAYQQFLYGLPRFNLRRSELLYRPRNPRAHKLYGFSEVEFTILTINQAMRRELYNLASFDDGNIPASLLECPPNVTPEQMEQFENWFNRIMVGDMQQRSRAKVVPAGTKLMPVRDQFDLQNKFDEWMARIFCFAVGISPIPFISMTNRSVAEELGDAEAEGGVAELKQFVERLVNTFLVEDLRMPHLRFNWTTDRSRLDEKRVNKNLAYVDRGIISRDEVRVEEGMEPIGVGHAITTAIGLVFIGKNAPPQAEPEPQPSPEPSGIAARARGAARLDELRKLEAYAVSRAKLGKDASGFVPEFLDADEFAEIERELVAKRGSIEAIRHVMANRRRKVPGLRFAPPSARDVAHRSGEVKTALLDILTRTAIETTAKTKAE